MVGKIETAVMDCYIGNLHHIVRGGVFLITFLDELFEIGSVPVEDHPIEVWPIQGDVLHGESKWPSSQRATLGQQLAPGDYRSLRAGLEIVDAKTAGKGEFRQS